jgi:hypothetical protein
MAACGDLDFLGDTTLPTADLLTLPLTSSAPMAPTATFFVFNDRVTTRRLLHPDAFNSLYLEVRFTTGSLASLNGNPLGPSDSVRVTLDPEPGGFGVTVSPNGLAFAAGARPTATFVFAAYGDISVANGSSYSSPVAYAQALAIWYEVTPGRWRRVSGSGYTGNDAVAGTLADPGTYLVAAPR